VILMTGDLSPYSAKIRMQIYAMGITDIKFETPMKLLTGKFKEVSAIGRIPALDVEGTIIPESEIIAEYLDEIYPEESMVGDTPLERAQVRTVSRIADIYLMNNIFMSLSQLMTKTPNQGILDLLLGQVNRGIGALEQHIGKGDYAVGDKLTRADCTLVPALWMCQGTVPRLGGENPIPGTEKVAAYWEKIQKNEYADKIIGEMKRGMKARLDGTEAKMRAAAIEKAGNA
jgi:glutathione S-transferase